MFEKIKNLDNLVLDNIGRMHTPALNIIMKTASRSANLGIIWWIVILPFIINKEWRITGFNFIVAISFAHLMGEGIIKHIVKRVRPCHGLDDDEQIINRPRFYSFPSGHTVASFTMLSVAIFRGLPIYVILPIAFLALLISFSRLYLRVHYLTDVLAGVLLGTTCGALAVLFFRMLGM